jgi:DNA-directed RNA polymerase specialized sigma24 family protein
MVATADRWPLFISLQRHDELTDEQRAALWYVRCLEQSYDHAGKLLNVSRHTVHRRLVEGEKLLVI